MRSIELYATEVAPAVRHHLTPVTPVTPFGERSDGVRSGYSRKR